MFLQGFDYYFKLIIMLGQKISETTDIDFLAMTAIEGHEEEEDPEKLVASYLEKIELPVKNEIPTQNAIRTSSESASALISELDDDILLKSIMEMKEINIADMLLQPGDVTSHQLTVGSPKVNEASKSLSNTSAQVIAPITTSWSDDSEDETSTVISSKSLGTSSGYSTEKLEKPSSPTSSSSDSSSDSDSDSSSSSSSSSSGSSSDSSSSSSSSSDTEDEKSQLSTLLPPPPSAPEKLYDPFKGSSESDTEEKIGKIPVLLNDQILPVPVPQDITSASSSGCAALIEPHQFNADLEQKPMFMFPDYAPVTVTIRNDENSRSHYDMKLPEDHIKQEERVEPKKESDDLGIRRSDSRSSRRSSSRSSSRSRSSSNERREPKNRRRRRSGSYERRHRYDKDRRRAISPERDRDYYRSRDRDRNFGRRREPEFDRRRRHRSHSRSPRPRSRSASRSVSPRDRDSRFHNSRWRDGRRGRRYFDDRGRRDFLDEFTDDRVSRRRKEFEEILKLGSRSNTVHPREGDVVESPPLQLNIADSTISDSELMGCQLMPNSGGTPADIFGGISKETLFEHNQNIHANSQSMYFYPPHPNMGREPAGGVDVPSADTFPGHGQSQNHLPPVGMNQIGGESNGSSSPKRLSLDERLEKEMGIKLMEEPPPSAKQQRQPVLGQFQPNNSGHSKTQVPWNQTSKKQSQVIQVISNQTIFPYIFFNIYALIIFSVYYLIVRF